jgi:type II restriction/modification system DNA methylase subunit YeeA
MNKTNTRKALNPAYRKHKPLRKDVNTFVEELKKCLQEVKISDDNGELEEHTKQHYINFFKSTFYNENYVNTKDRIDLAIYTGKTAKSDVSVIIEAKKPSNKAEFLTETNLNRKALQELLLYYLRERVDNQNNNIKHLIATNGYEWFLFKAEDFYNYFYKNKALLKEYKAFRDGLKDTSKNELFYNEIAKKYIEEVQQTLPFVHLDFTKTNFNKLSDTHLNTLYKIFSNVHLLGHSFGNDSNQLNKTFYNELLHIIGLEEVKDKGKKVISRKAQKDRDYASLLESTIFHLEDRDYLHKIKSIDNNNEKAFNAGLELCLTWVNRILFLKLLESQLLAYHKNNSVYKFLNSKFINGYDDLNDLFFSALAKKEEDRHPRFKDKYQHIPYLNSSLFERSILEDEAFEISALNNDEIEIYNSTVLKDANGKKQKGKLKTLDYLFLFLDAYDFATDGNEGIEDAQETKSLINASVLGLIFEKINGYKEGSFYTPAYITMYMCKETLRRAVVQKFKEQENDQIETFEDLQSYCQRYFKIDDIKRFNTIVNSLRICDPAVGSGHFLVSALNELIVIKNQLGILADAKGLPLRCDIEIVNDELYVIDDNGALFEYNPTEKESTRIQHTLFHQKQTLIENCLFGVDINPNSVKICRLRLWIELLKNAYYTKENRLQTLPNIDINIKCGNSLISRFSLDDDLKDAFKGKQVNYNFKDYKNAVAEYKDTNSKDRKREVLQIIDEVKHNFTSTLDNTFIAKFQKAQGELINEQERQNNLKQFGETITKKDKDALKKLKTKAENALIEKEEIVNNAIYHNAFEWRFEFPEVLADDGSYVGFDAVIGNPPYLIEYDKKVKSNLEINFIEFKRNNDLYVAFISRGNKILNHKGFLSYITPNTFMKGTYFQKLRELLISNKIIEIINFNDTLVFDEANVYTSILLFQKGAIPANWVLKKGISETEGEIDKNELDFIYKSPLIKRLDVFEKFDNFFLIKDVGFNYWSIGRGKTRGGSVGSRILYSGKQLDDSDKPYLKGGDIFRYSQKIPSNYLRHNFEELLNENDVFRFSKDFFEINPKIIYRQTSKDIIATIDTNCNYNDKTVHIVVNNEKSNFDLYFVLGLLNSSLLNFYLHFYKQESGKAFAQIKTVDIKAMPFIYEESISVSIKQKVTQILLLKKDNPEVDTTALEAEIDTLVYKLYNLTDEEISIVENS